MSKKSSEKVKHYMEGVYVEWIVDVALAFERTPKTIMSWAMEDDDWTSMMYRAVRHGELVSDEDYFFPLGTIKRHKSKFPKNKNTSQMAAMKAQLDHQRARIDELEREAKK